MIASQRFGTSRQQAYLGHKNIRHTVRSTELSPDRFKDFWRATVHVSSRENAAQLALTVVSVPSVDVREVLHLLHALWLKLEGRRLILAE